MAKVLGDTHADAGFTTPQFIAIDDEAFNAGRPIHAHKVRRLLRNSNWLEAKTRRMRLLQTWNEVTPYTLKNGGWRCFGPWMVYSTRPELKFQFGYSATIGTKRFLYYLELRSEGNPVGWTPGTNEATIVTAGSGLGTVISGPAIAKKAQPNRVDFCRMWIRMDADTPTLTKDVAGGAAATTGTIVDAGITALVCTASGASPDWTRSEFFSQSITVNVKSGASLIGGPFNVSEVVASTIPESGVLNDTLVIESQTIADLPVLSDYVGATFELLEPAAVRPHYLMLYEDSLTTVEETEPLRSDYVGLDDTLAHTGNTQLASTAHRIQTNAEAVGTRNPDTVVNDVIWPNSGFEVSLKALDAVQISGNTTGYTTLARYRVFVEREHNVLRGWFTYAASASSAQPFRLEGRILIENTSGGLVQAGTAKTFDPVVLSQNFEITDPAYINQLGWQGKWMQNITIINSPELVVDTTALAGGAWNVMLFQVRPEVTTTTTERINMAFRSFHALTQYEAA